MASSAEILDECATALVLLVCLRDGRCMTISIGADGRSSAVYCTDDAKHGSVVTPQAPTHDPRINGYSVEFLGAQPAKLSEDY